MRFLKLCSMILPLCLGHALAAARGAQPGPAGTDIQLCEAGPPGIRTFEAVQAADRQIAVGRFRFRIVRVAFDTTASGFVPEGMGPKDLLMFVECELLSGRRDDFKGLTVVLDRGSGRRSKASILFSGGMMKALTALTIKSASYDYRPANSNIAWAFVVQEAEGDFSLIFPAGTVIDLAPWIKDALWPFLDTRADEVQATRFDAQSLGEAYKIMFDLPNAAGPGRRRPGSRGHTVNRSGSCDGLTDQQSRSVFDPGDTLRYLRPQGD